MIPESFIQELLARVDVAEVVGRYVQLKKGGANLLGLCPFHNEKSPSFTVSPTKQFYHCFGCGAHGSAINFLMEHTGATFPEAIRTLASEVGLTVPEASRSPQQRAQDRQRKAEVSQQQQIIDAAQAHYERGLRDYTPAQEYLKNRGLTGKTAKNFALGWSGNERRGLSSVYPNYEDPLLVESGLVIEADDGRRYDRFRQRIMFPIRNTRGHIIGFGGRIIGPGEPKYLNSPETPLFSKGHELYGLWESRQGIRQEGFVAVVEGYMDVVALSQAGLHNAVATLGTATTEHHIKKLIRASDRIVFCFDADRAGKQAAWRALTTCLPLIRDDVSMRFMFLPDGHDPDSYVTEHGAEAFREYASTATALSTFMLEELAARHPLAEAEGRAACVHEAIPYLLSMPELTLARQIQNEFAKLVQLTSDELQQRLQQERSSKASTSVVSSVDTKPSEAMGHYDIPYAAADYDDYEHVEAYYDPSAFYHENVSEQKRQGVNKKRNGRRSGASPTVRSVVPIAKRLLRLLVAHPRLVEGLSDQQLEIIVQSPNLILVQDLIALINTCDAKHSGALLEAADTDTEIGEILEDLMTDVMGDEELPNPELELSDTIRRVEFELVCNELESLASTGLPDEHSRRRYQELFKRRSLLSAASNG